jgi:hypothetical protein
MTIALAIGGWILFSCLATVGMAAVCRGGRMEDEALGYVPAPRTSPEDVREESLI